MCVNLDSVQFSSVTQSCPTLCDPMNHSTPALPVHHQLPEFTETHVLNTCKPHMQLLKRKYILGQVPQLATIICLLRVIKLALNLHVTCQRGRTTNLSICQAQVSMSSGGVSHSVVPSYLRPQGLQPTRPLCAWDSPGNNTGVCCHSLLQLTFPPQGSNPGLLHCRQILYHLSCMEAQENIRIEIYNYVNLRIKNYKS